MDHIKVYKSDVKDRGKARLMREAIQNKFKNHEVSFDLEDVDNVLRIESHNGPIDEPALKDFLESRGYTIKSLL